jgi:hypothetical protein
MPTPSPFHGEGPSWKRNLLFGVLGIVLVGGSLSYVFKDQLGGDSSEPVSLDTVNTDETTESDLYGSYDSDFSWDTSTIEEVDDFDTQVSATEGYTTFTDYYFGFQIDYPEAWTLYPAYDYTSFTSDYEGNDDYLLENFNIGIEDLSAYGSMTLDEYSDAALDQLLSESAYTFLEQSSQGMGSYEGRLLVGSYDIGGEQAGVKSFFTVHENTAYVLTYMYELPEKDVYSATIAHVLESFTLLEEDSVPSNEKVIDTQIKQPNAEVDDTDLGFTSILHLYEMTQ